MEMSMLKEGGRSARIVAGPNGISGRSARIVPGPNGITFDGGDQVKFMGDETTQNHDIFSTVNVKAPKRDVSFSSYLAGSTAGQGPNRELKGSSSIEAGDGDINISAFEKGLEKQISFGKRVTKDSEISIFEAEKYFSSQEAKDTDANHEPATQGSKPRENSNFKEIMQASNNKVLLSSPDLYDSRHRISSPASSIDAVNRTFRPGGATSTTASSDASWNSQSGLLSTAAGKSVHKLASSDRKRQSTKWSFGCTCPCSNKKSVDTDDTLTENRRAPSVTSTALMDSPFSSIKYSYAGLVKRVLGRSIEKQKTQAFVDNASEMSDVSSCINGGSGIKTLINPGIATVDYNIRESGLSKDKELQKKMKRNSSSFMIYDKEFGQGELEEGTHQRTNHSTLVKEDGFSFPILPKKSEETPRPSLEVFGSPFPGTPDREETRSPTSGMGVHNQRQPSDLHRHLVLCSLDKARKSITFDSKLETHKFTGSHSNGDVDQDKESDSSSDLFEIGSLTTQGTSCYAFRRRDSMDDTTSIQSGFASTTSELGFHNSFHFGGIEDTVTPSAQSFCYEPSEASLDWSVTTGDTMDKASLGKFSSDYEDLKKHVSLQGLDLSGLREASMMGSSKRRLSRGSFLGCGSEMSVSVAAPTDHPYNTRYNYEKNESLKSRLPTDNFCLSREKRVTDINASSVQNVTNCNLKMSGKKPMSQPRH